MKSKRLIIFVVAAMLSAIYGQQLSKVGTSAGTFLKIEPDARSMGMGGAFVATADDASSLWWNPAGMARIGGSSAVFNHSIWFADISYNFAGVTYDLNTIGQVGLSMVYLDFGDMEKTTERQPLGTGEIFNANSFAIGFSYSRLLTETFSFGATFKYIQENIDNMSARTVAFDIGMLYETPFDGLRLGMAMTNYGLKLQLDGDDTAVPIDVYPGVDGTRENVVANLSVDAFDLPLLFRVGLAKELYEDDILRATLAADAKIPNDNFSSVNTGLEFAYQEMFFVRGGYQELFLADTEKGLTLGLGMKMNVQNFNFTVDYAYNDVGRLKDIQKFTVSLTF
jgi:hypothetical protein